MNRSGDNLTDQDLLDAAVDRANKAESRLAILELSLKYAARQLEFYGHEAVAVNAWNMGELQPPAIMSDPECTTDSPVTNVDWKLLCATAPKTHPDHWAFVHLACCFNHLGAALILAGVDPNLHRNETTVPDEDRANLQEVFCAWKNVRFMIKEIAARSSSADSSDE